jgi:hypothetical protein
VITNRRTLTYVAIALIVGAALALAVALARSDAPAASSGPAAVQTQAQGGVLGDTAGAGAFAGADPARQEPLLDQFTAKDPFVPLTVATPAPNPTSSPNSTSSPSPNPTPNPSLSARVKVNGTNNGHTISVLSITGSNGTALATFEVDRKTYADKKVGDVFSTSAGEIKVIAINMDAQTVTFVLGDQSLTLRAGQVIVK